jgi:uncharacterized protein (TIGR02145 family)
MKLIINTTSGKRWRTVLYSFQNVHSLIKNSAGIRTPENTVNCEYIVQLFRRIIFSSFILIFFFFLTMLTTNCYASLHYFGSSFGTGSSHSRIFEKYYDENTGMNYCNNLSAGNTVLLSEYSSIPLITDYGSRAVLKFDDIDLTQSQVENIISIKIFITVKTKNNNGDGRVNVTGIFPPVDDCSTGFESVVDSPLIGYTFGFDGAYPNDLIEIPLNLTGIDIFKQTAGLGYFLVGFYEAQSNYPESFYGYSNSTYYPFLVVEVADSDSTPPSTSITSGPTGTITTSSASFSYTGSDIITSTDNLVYAYRLVGSDSAWSIWTSATSKSYSNLSNGTYTFEVKAKDEAGNEDATPASRSFTVDVGDSTPPTTIITDGPSGTIPYNYPCFSYTGSDNITSTANLVYSWRMVGYNFASSNIWSNWVGGLGGVCYDNMPNGTYTFEVKARDEAGNEDATPASRSFAVSMNGLLWGFISPQEAATAGGAWRRVGTSTWNNNAGYELVTGGIPYEIEWKPISGWTTPLNQTITPRDDGTGTMFTGVYTQSGSLTRIISLSGNLSFGNINVNQSSQKTFIISNTGNSTLTVSSISFPSGFSGSWSGTIVAGGSKSVTVTFSPTSTTAYGGTITVNSDKTSGTNTISCSGAGVSTPTRIISLSGNLSFGNINVNQSSQKTFIISNTGNSTLTVSSISFPSGFSGSWSGTIVAGGSKSVTVTFSPTSTTAYGGTITVNSDKTSGTNTISCSGAGVSTPTRIISLSGNLSFGNINVNQSSQKTFIISNTGNSTLTVSSISFPSGFSGSWSGTIVAGGSKSVTVTFSPTSTTAYGGTITVNSDKTSGTNTISCSGAGVSTPTRIISLSGNLSFGNINVNQSSQKTFIISNTGNSTLTVSSISFPSGFSGSWSGTIVAGGSKSVTVTFSPTSTTAYGGTITVNSDKTSGTNTISCSGAGVSTFDRSAYISTIPSILSLLLDDTTQREDVHTVISNGRIWMDRNLGASRVAISSTDTEAYGDLYQWGRVTDGHEKRTSGTTTTLSGSNSPGHSNFIRTSSSPYDWRTPQNANLWQGTSGVNNPCPAGFRLPTRAEWETERASWSSNNRTGAYNSPLKLAMAGLRFNDSGTIRYNNDGYYWSSTADGSTIFGLFIDPSNSGFSGGYRAHGFSVRCIKD